MAPIIKQMQFPKQPLVVKIQILPVGEMKAYPASGAVSRINQLAGHFQMHCQEFSIGKFYYQNLGLAQDTFNNRSRKALFEFIGGGLTDDLRVMNTDVCYPLTQEHFLLIPF